MKQETSVVAAVEERYRERIHPLRSGSMRRLQKIIPLFRRRLNVCASLLHAALRRTTPYLYLVSAKVPRSSISCFR